MPYEGIPIRGNEHRAPAWPQNAECFAKNTIHVRDVLGDLSACNDIERLPGFYMSLWFGFWAPRGTTKEIVGKINAAVVDALGDPMVRERLANLGMEIPSREQQTPEALRAFQKAEIEKWWPIIKAAGIKAQ
jgi:Tripartite tricarboxylate transporter family receptor